MPDTIRVTVELPGLSAEEIEILRAMKPAGSGADSRGKMIAGGMATSLRDVDGRRTWFSTALGRAVLAHYKGGGA